MKESLKSNAVIRRLFFFTKDIALLAKRSWQGFLLWDVRIALICWARYLLLARILGKVETLSSVSTGVANETVQHNLKGLSLFAINSFSGSRPKQLLSLINTLNHVDKKNARVLIIGPRAESEFFIAKAFGFSQSNLFGLDLIKYSSYVTVGDMHEIPFDDSYFDIVIAGWVLAYSNHLGKACSEIIRVCKPGGLVIQGTQYTPLSIEEINARLGYIPGSQERIKGNHELKYLFKDSIDHIFHDIDITQIAPKLKSDFILCFSTKHSQ